MVKRLRWVIEDLRSYYGHWVKDQHDGITCRGRLRGHVFVNGKIYRDRRRRLPIGP